MTIYAPAGTFAVAAQNIATGVAAKIADADNQFQQAERLALGGARTFSAGMIELRYRDDIRMDYEIHEECHNQRQFQIVQMTQDDDMQVLKLTVHRSI